MAALAANPSPRHRAGGEALNGNTLLVRRYVKKHPALAARVPRLVEQVRDAEHQESINAVLQEQFRSAGLPAVPEYRFAPPRRWAFDFAFPDLLLAIEIEGIDHRKKNRYARDLSKYNTAARRGWCLLRFTARQVHDRTAIQEIEQVYRERLTTRPRRTSGLPQAPP